MPDIGKLLKLRIWHEKRNPFSGWHLAKATLLKTLTMEKYSFTCGRWLDVNEDDNEIVRELPAMGSLIDEPLPRESISMQACHAAFLTVSCVTQRTSPLCHSAKISCDHMHRQRQR